MVAIPFFDPDGSLFTVIAEHPFSATTTSQGGESVLLAVYLLDTFLPLGNAVLYTVNAIIFRIVAAQLYWGVRTLVLGVKAVAGQ